MKHFRVSLFLIAGLLLFASCKTTGAARQASVKPVYITNTKKINLLSPEKSAEVFDGLQLFNGSFGDSSFTMMSYTQIDAKGINLSLINDFGTDMGNLFYDGNQVKFESAYLPEKLPGEYIVEEIQNAYYDEEVLRENYAAAKLRFEVQKDAADAEGNIYEVRRIFDGKNLIEKITKTEGKVRITNYLRGYAFELINAE